MSEKFSVVYFGNDDGYWHEIQKRFKQRYDGLRPEFKSFFESSPEAIQSLVIKVFEIKPKIIFIDFTKYYSEYLHLARLIMRMNYIDRLIVIGLVGQREFTEIHSDIYLSGISCCHIKGGEFHDVIYDAMMLYNPKAAIDHGFCNATLADIIEIAQPVRVNYIVQDHLHIESDFRYPDGTVLRIDNYWSKKNFFKSNAMEIISSGDENLFYHFPYNCVLKFHYFDLPKEEDFIDSETYNQKVVEHGKKTEKAKKELAYWIADYTDTNKPKLLRTMIIDHDLTIYNNQKKTDEYPYVIRCKPYLKSVSKELKALKPHLLIFQLNDADHGKPVNKVEIESKEDMRFPNNINTLKVMIDNFEYVKDCLPFIVVFNAKYKSETLQEKLNYAKLMTISQPMDMDLIVKIFEKLEKKLSQNANTLYPAKSVVLKRTDPKSKAELINKVRLIECSETDLLFGCKQEITPYSVFRCLNPMPFYITVLPWVDNQAPGVSPTGEPFVYKALIHGISEDKKMELRQFINSVFFRELEESKKLAQEELDAIKQKYLDQLQAAQQEQEEEGDQEESSEEKTDES